MRSSQRPGIVSATFAVARTGRATDRAPRRVVIWNAWFCAGSSTSRSAADGSPRQSGRACHVVERMTGFIVPASRSARTRPPGQRAMYVRRWPRFRLRPHAAERHATNFRSGRAGDRLADEVLPVPGGPTSVENGARAAIVDRGAFRAEVSAPPDIPYPLLHLVRPAWSASSTSRACFGSRRSSDRVDHGIASSQSRYVRIMDDSAF